MGIRASALAGVIVGGLGAALSPAGAEDGRQHANLDTLASFPPFGELPPEAKYQTYEFDTFAHQVSSIPFLTVGVFGATAAIGVLDWDWGSSGFNFHSEGWFGKDTANGGMDKLGHAYGTYVLTDVFTQAIRRNAEHSEWAEITGVALSMTVMTAVEILDGFSTSHGFSYEDMIMDAIGAGFGYLRNTVPGLREKLDFRLEYLPSGNTDGFNPHSDYSGQKYLLALKFAGFETLEDTPLRFLEFQVGYFARGFTREEKLDGDKKRREPYVGIGLNLQELLFGWPRVRDTVPGRIARRTLEYVQVPYTYVAYPYD